jgi:hypothetical protein
VAGGGEKTAYKRKNTKRGGECEVAMLVEISIANNEENKRLCRERVKQVKKA